MAFLIPTNAVQIARFANGLYGLQLGFASTNGITSDVASGGLLATFNNYYSLSFGAMTTAAVAQQIVTNLGIVAGSNGQTASSVSVALAYVTGQLNAAAPAARGAAVKAVLDLWSSISADPVNSAAYGAAATAWNKTISNAVQYAGAVNPDITAAQAALIPVAPQAYALTTGLDTINGSSSSGSNNITGIANGTTATFTPGDSITGGAGVANTLTINDSNAAAAAGTATSWTPTAAGGITVAGIQTASFNSNNTVIANTTATGGSQGYTGLTQLNINSNQLNGASASITVAPTTNVSYTEAGHGGAVNTGTATTTILGGNAVTATITGGTAAAQTIQIGSTTAGQAPVGAIALTNTIPTNATLGTANSAQNINTWGGSSVAITSVINPGAVSPAAPTPTSNNLATTTIAVVGTSATTSVNVTQTKSASNTETVSFLPMPNTGGTEIVATVAGATWTITGTAASAGGSPTGYTGAQVAIVAAGGIIPGLVLTTPSTANGNATNPLTLWTPAAGGPVGNTLTYSANATQAAAAAGTYAQGTQPAAALILNGGTITPTISATTGGIFNSNVTITDVNSSSSANGTITSATVSGISPNGGAVGSVVINANALATLNLTNITASTVTLNNNQSPATNTALALNLNGTTAGSTSSTASSAGTVFIDTNAELKSLAITTAGTSAALSLSTGTQNITTITVGGTSVMTLFGIPTTSQLSSLTVTGKAGLVETADLGNASKLTSITSSSSGPIQLALAQTSSLAQGFTSTGTGQDVIILTAQALAPIAAGSATNNILVYNAPAPSSLSGSSAGTVTGFQILGTAGFSTGTFNMSTIGAAFTSIEVTASNAANSLTFSNVTPGTGLLVDATNTSAGAGTLTYATTGTTGASNSLNLTLGIPTTDSKVTAGLTARGTPNAITVPGLILQDSTITQTVANGVGTLNVTTTATNGAQSDVIATLTDTSLSNLTISGSAGLNIGTFTSGLSSSLTITNNSTSTAASQIGTTALTNHNLTSLTLAGSGILTIPALNDNSSVLTITETNTNTIAPVITTFTGAALSSLSINGTGGMQFVTETITGTVTSIANNTGNGTLTLGVLPGVANNVSPTTGLNDTALTNVTFTGNAPINVYGFNGATAGVTVTNSDTAAVSIPIISSIGNVVETFMNTSASTFNIGSTINVAPALTTLTLVGNVAYNNNVNTISITTTVGTGATVSNTTGLAVNEAITGTGIPLTVIATTVTSNVNTTTINAPSTGLFVGEPVIGVGINSAAITGNASNTAATITSSAGLWVGEPVSGTGIPAGTFIATIPAGGTTFTFSQATTASVTSITVPTPTITSIPNATSFVISQPLAAALTNPQNVSVLDTVAGITTGGALTLGTAATAAGTVTATVGSPSASLATVTGASDNANVTLNTGNNSANLTVSLGNGNNTIIDSSAVTFSNLTLGTGNNTVTLGQTQPYTPATANAVDVVRFGTHAGGADNVSVGYGATLIATTLNTNAMPATNIGAAPYWIYGTSASVAMPGDTITFQGFANTGSVATRAQFSQSPVANTAALQTVVVSAATSITTNGGTASFTYNGDTYIVADLVAGTAQTIVEITGIHTISANVNGVTTILT